MQYAIAFFGSFLYNFILFVISKGNSDKQDLDFDYKKYLKINWDNWALTVFLAPVLVWYMPDIVDLLNSKMSLELAEHKIFYLGAGPLTEVVLFGMFKLLGWKESFVTKAHKE